MVKLITFKCMEKKHAYQSFVGSRDLFRLLLVMKLTYLLTICCILQAYANAYAQYHVSLDVRDARIKDVLKEIQRSSAWRFVYHDDLLPDESRVTIKAKDQPITDVLTQVLKPSGLMHRQVNDRLIVILPSPEDGVQDSLVRGRVRLRDAAGELFTIAGVTVRVPGTALATSTADDGSFSLRLADTEATLEIAYMGYGTRREPLRNRTEIDVILDPETVQLEDVVITALGIPRERRSLTYAAQTLAGETLSNSRETNITSALNGRIAGLTINKTNAGPGSSNRIVFRGNRSITGNNQPLIVVDGVRIDNTPKAFADVALFGARDNGDGISNINPDDIASINVLTGPSAAALYGSSASNGAVIITTKTGRKDRQTAIGISSSYMWESPMIYPRFQNVYGQGEGGLYSAQSDQSWGPAMDGQQLADWTGETRPFSPQPDNFRDFFRTGGETINTLTLSAGNETLQTYLSYTNTYANGIIDGNDFKRNNINLRQTARLGKKLVADAKINYIYEDVINRQATGEANRAVSTLYRIPRNIDLADARDFETLNDDGTLTQNYWRPGSPSMQNPYWSIYRNLYDRLRNRVMGMVSLKYEFTPTLSLQYRTSLDYYADQVEERNYNDTYWLLTPGKGNYVVGNEASRLFINDLLLSYSTRFGDHWGLNLNAGAILEQYHSNGTRTNNNGLSIPNLFSLGNALASSSTSSLARTETQSLFAAASVGYRDYIYLDVSMRNDWNSTLPAGNRSYFFPSFGANVLWNEALQLPEAITFLKTRASYAFVGNGTAFNMLKPSFSIVPGGTTGLLLIDRTMRNADLKPEQTRSIEAGVDLGLWADRFGLSATFYKSNTVNQILTIGVPNPSGYAFRVINAGNIQNKGVELQLHAAPVAGEHFRWRIDMQFGANKNSILELDSLQKRPPLSSPDRIGVIVAEEGKGYGELYTRGFVRNTSGQIIVGNNGLPLLTDMSFHAGNYNPKWTAGISNALDYGPLRLAFLIDMRKGGTVLSHTQALMAAAGVAERTLANRESTFVIPNSVREDGSPNTLGVTPEAYWTHVGGSDPVGEAFLYQGTNARLRELSLGYTLPPALLSESFIKQATLSLVGRNLFFLYNAADGFDPESALGTGNNQGIEYTPMPSTRSYGLHLKIDF